MWKEMFKEEIEELKELGVHTKRVKCGEFYSIAQVVAFYKKVKPFLKEEDNEIKKEQE